MQNTKNNNTAIITGANNGIGLELTRRLLSEGWQIIALIRSSFPQDDNFINKAIQEGRIRTYRAELTDFDSLKAALKEIKTHEEKADLLFNNAGGSLSELSFSKQGREKHFELQTVVPYIIYMELKDLLKKGTMTTVVNTSSSAMNTIKSFDADTLAHPTTFKKLFGPYATTKLALSLWTRELAPAASDEGITILSVDPGGNNTLRKDKNSGLPFYIKPLMKFLFAPPTKGASLLYEAALGPAKGSPGDFLIKGKPRKLKYVQQSGRVLEIVQSIYYNEFNNN
ncbi:SDR family NAD(P)-dependent oxidoreductase [Paenibacillus sp. sgz500958]|uniref:SDR family NAD(P)-dependent oxidoreductase n=1 Tax=Paenibacillus sp. sgz500958 TaxID=3242475 RepID=UPI0036D24C65